MLNSQGSRFKVQRAWGIIAAIVFTATPALAMVVLPADFSEMVTSSELVVHARVVDVRPQMSGDRRTIETMVTVTVLDSLKGDPGATVYFRVPGGQVGRYRRVMVGAPEFASGDEVVLFLRGRAPAVPMPFGLSQGVYRVARKSDGRAMVTPPVVSDSVGRVVRGDPARRPLELSAFEREVRAAAERQQ